MFSAREIIGSNLQQLLDPSSTMRKSFFWKKDSQDKRKVEPLQNWNVYHYVDEFLPAFGFYKYRDNEDSDYRVVQKLKRRVKMVGPLRDRGTADDIFNWTLETLSYLQGTACDLPDEKNLRKAIMYKSDMFSAWTMKFLPELPKVETQDENGKCISVPQRPLKDNPEQAHLCFKNNLVVVRADRDPTAISYSTLPPELFIWDKQIREFDISNELLEEGPHGVWWDFFQNLSKENNGGEWVVNHGMLTTLMTAYGYLLHDFTPPDLKKAVVLYDRTTHVREGGAGKSILVDSLDCNRPCFWIDAKRISGDQRFLMDGYREDKRIVIFSDLKSDWKLEDYYNYITDGFTVEDKGKSKFVVDKKKAPKIAINTNYTIPAVQRSDRRRLFFVPISQFYGVLADIQNKTPADIHGGWLIDDNWTTEDWTAFYVTCIHCLHTYLKESLVPFDDSVLLDRQLLAAAGHDETLLQILQDFIEEVMRSGGECTRTQVLNLYKTEPDLEKYYDWKDNWKTSRFKSVAIGMGYQVNPGRLNGRYQQVINGKHEDCYLLVKPIQPGSSNDEPEPEPKKDPPKGIDPNSPFANFKFGDDEDD